MRPKAPALLAITFGALVGTTTLRAQTQTSVACEPTDRALMVRLRRAAEDSAAIVAARRLLEHPAVLAQIERMRADSAVQRRRERVPPTTADTVRLVATRRVLESILDRLLRCDPAR